MYIVYPDESFIYIGLNILNTAKEMCEYTFVEFDLNGIWFGLTLNCVHISLMIILSWDKINLRSVINPKLLVSCTVGVPEKTDF